MIKSFHRFEQLGVRVLCALALLLIGFAHTPPAIANHVVSPSELAELVLPDGTIAVLCVPSEDGSTKQTDHASNNGCETCRLAASVVLPSPADAFGERILRADEPIVPVRAEVFYRQLFLPNASPRGPPSGLTA
ncbi:hypothetical protein [Rhizobium rhizogenes]|uniref:hypothetical protein n=1 Tax=Rhizobium rhizogenes TaxID=359 RepID=UPI0022C22929|nr:hypothetical protein [Rhizobium rhizogenes]MCZ7486221.1 hypothetical protein [Rhizobium rhizogenes]